jgi:hypothetical protein
LSAKPYCSRTSTVRAHRLGHGLHEPDHVLRLLNGAVGEEQVDQDPGLDVLERAEVALDRAQRLGSLPRASARRCFRSAEYAACSRNTSVFRRSICGCGQIGDQLEDRAVGRCRARRFERGRERRAVVVRGGRTSLGVQFVRQHAVGCEVEGGLLHVGADEHGRVRPRRVSHAELVEDVRIGSREVGDRVVREDQPLEHGLVD